MKTLSTLLSIALISFCSCTKEALLSPEMLSISKTGTSNGIGNTPTLENIDLNLLKTGATINLYVDEKK